jgi:hypothetical protein
VNLPIYNLSTTFSAQFVDFEESKLEEKFDFNASDFFHDENPKISSWLKPWDILRDVKVAQLGNIPHHALLHPEHESIAGKWMCSGAIIGVQWIITVKLKKLTVLTF